MATSKDYIEFVLELLKEVDNVFFKKVTGEYILYKNNAIFRGVYDNRFLVKKTPSLGVYHFKE